MFWSFMEEIKVEQLKWERDSNNKKKWYNAFVSDVGDNDKKSVQFKLAIYTYTNSVYMDVFHCWC